MVKWWKKERVEYKPVRARSLLHRYYDVDDSYYGLTVNPYSGCSHRCVYCYATFEWNQDFFDIVKVKVNAPSVLRNELLSWRKSTIEPVFLSTATDPYQPAEGVYRVTRRIIEILQSKGIPYYIFTKSSTIVRDLDIHAKYKDKCIIVWSLTSVDEKIKKLIEPGASPAKSIFKAMRLFSERGVLTGVNVDPVIPGLTDDPTHLRRIIKETSASGGSFASIGVLRIRNDIWERIKKLLISSGLTRTYRTLIRLYFREGRKKGPYLLPPDNYVKSLRDFFESEVSKAGLSFGIPVENTLEDSNDLGFQLRPVRLWYSENISCYLQW